MTTPSASCFFSPSSPYTPSTPASHGSAGLASPPRSAGLASPPRSAGLASPPPPSGSSTPPQVPANATKPKSAPLSEKMVKAFIEQAKPQFSVTYLLQASDASSLRLTANQCSIASSFPSQTPITHSNSTTFVDLKKISISTSSPVYKQYLQKKTDFENEIQKITKLIVEAEDDSKAKSFSEFSAHQKSWLQELQKQSEATVQKYQEIGPLLDAHRNIKLALTTVWVELAKRPADDTVVEKIPIHYICKPDSSLAVEIETKKVEERRLAIGHLPPKPKAYFSDVTQKEGRITIECCPTHIKQGVETALAIIAELESQHKDREDARWLSTEIKACITDDKRLFSARLKQKLLPVFLELQKTFKQRLANLTAQLKVFKNSSAEEFLKNPNLDNLVKVQFKLKSGLGKIASSALTTLLPVAESNAKEEAQFWPALGNILSTRYFAYTDDGSVVAELMNSSAKPNEIHYVEGKALPNYKACAWPYPSEHGRIASAINLVLSQTIPTPHGELNIFSYKRISGVGYKKKDSIPKLLSEAHAANLKELAAYS